MVLPTTLLFSESPVIGFLLLILLFIAYYFKYRKLMILTIIILIFIMFFYRYYPYNKRHLSNIIISPANGTITDLKITNNYCHISIFLSPLNIHTQIYPINGAVIKRIYDQTGMFNLATNMDKSRKNEKKIHIIQTNNNKLIKVAQIAGFLPRRISSSNKVPENVKAGEYLGIIKFGSRVDILFPIENFKLNVKEGQSIAIGEQIGYYKIKN